MPEAEVKDTNKVIMIIGVSKAARATTLKMVERGNTVILVATSAHQAYLDEMGKTITEMGGSSLTMGLDDCNNLLEIQALWEATVTQYKNVNTCLHFSKGFGKINPEVLEFLQDKVNPVTGTTTCTMTDKWISKQALDEMGQSVLPEEIRFPDFVTQRVLGIREFEQREIYHLVDKEAEPRRAAEAERRKALLEGEKKQPEEVKQPEEKKEPPATVHVTSTPAKKGAPPPPATAVTATPSTPLANKPAPAPSGTVRKAAPPPPSPAAVDPSTPNYCKSCKRVGNSGNWCNFCGQRR